MLRTRHIASPKSASASAEKSGTDERYIHFNLDALTYTPPPPVEDLPRGAQLNGRRISIVWTDGEWFEAVVVCYYPKKDTHKIVYVQDGSLEVIKLGKGGWSLIPTEGPGRGALGIVGATIAFVHPEDDKVYGAIVYKCEFEGDRLHVAYISEKKTDTLSGKNWDLMKTSPCFRRREE